MMKKNSRLKNSILNLGTSVIATFLSAALHFIVRTVFVNTLGKTFLGIQSYFSDILKMLSLTELGFGTAIVYRLFKPLAQGDDKRVRVLLKFYRLAYTVIGISILVLGLILIPFLPSIIKNYDRLILLDINPPLIFVICLLQTVVSYLFFAYRTSIMRANQKKYILTTVDYSVTIVTNLVQIAILVLWKDFIIYLTVVIFFNIARNFINAYISQRFYPQYFIPEPDSISRQEVKEMFKDCGALFLFRVNNIVLKATDNMVIGFFLGMGDVGIYSNYLSLYHLLTGFASKMYSSIAASVGNLFATANVKTKYNFFETMNFVTVLGYGTAAVCVAVCTDEIIDVWIGKEYLIAKPFSILIGFEILFHGLKVNLTQIRTVSGVFKQMWYRPIISGVINLASSIFLVRKIGIHGVIIGTIISDLFSNFLIDPFIITKYTFDNYKPCSLYYKKNIVYISLLSIIGFAEIYICNGIYIGHGWLSVLVHLAISGISVPLILICLFWKSHECQYLVSILKRILDKVRSKTIRR